MSFHLSRHGVYVSLAPGAIRNKSSRVSPFASPETTAFVASATSVDQLPKLNGLPEVVVTGRANVGKSTFLNAIFGRRELAHTSKKAGHTRALNFYRVGAEPGKLVVVDAPGYGARGRPEWGDLFSSYVDSRVELRRIYMLFNAKHGLKDTDLAMLTDLNEKCLTSHGTRFTLQSIITKADTLADDEIEYVISKMRKRIFHAAPTCLPPIITSCAMKPMFGIEEARTNMAEACGVKKHS